MEPETVAPQPIIIDPPVVDQQIVLPAPQAKKFPVLTWLLLIFLSISAAFSIYLFLQVRAMTLEKSTPSPTPTPIASVDPTSSWQTYINSKLGFEIKYPETVSIDKEMNDQYNRATIFKGDNLNFEVMLRKIGTGTLDKYFFMDNPDFSKSLLDNQEANIYSYDASGSTCVSDGSGPGCPISYVVYVAQKGPDLYHVGFYGTSKLTAQEKQILSTFKFIDSSTGDDKTALENFVKDTVFAYGKSHGLSSKDQIIVKIIQLAGNFASGSIAYTKEVEGSGESWFATKQNDNWIMVEETQEPPSCALMEQYQFPKSIYGECIAK